MTEREWLAERFEEHRGHLRAVAYRMLGSLSEADDVVQETWLRLSRSDAGAIENLGGWLTTVVARLCLNVLKARRTRPDLPVGVRLPDPVVSRAGEMGPEVDGRWQSPVSSSAAGRSPKSISWRTPNGCAGSTSPSEPAEAVVPGDVVHLGW